MIRRAAPTCVGLLQGTDIELINYLDNKPGKVVFRELLVDRGRKQVAGLAVNGVEAAHFSAHLGRQVRIIPFALR